jgi:hypothetical protein
MKDASPPAIRLLRFDEFNCTVPLLAPVPLALPCRSDAGENVFEAPNGIAIAPHDTSIYAKVTEGSGILEFFQHPVRRDFSKKVHRRMGRVSSAALSRNTLGEAPRFRFRNPAGKSIAMNY